MIILVVVTCLFLAQDCHTNTLSTNENLQRTQENNVSINTEELIKNAWIRLLRTTGKRKAKESTAVSSPGASIQESHKREMKPPTHQYGLFNSGVSNRNLQRRSFLPNLVPYALAGFMVSLKNPILIPKNRFTFLSEFTDHNPSNFIRGLGLDLRLGRYTVPYTALYNFQVNLNIQRPLHKGNNKIDNDGITARLCINGECYNNIMKFRADTTSNSKTRTINMSGHLMLQKNEYVEIVVENSLTTRIVVVNGIFSAYLVGS